MTGEDVAGGTDAGLVALATAVDARIGEVLGLLDAWCAAVRGIRAAGVGTAPFDDAVAALVLPQLTRADALLSGAGFVGADAAPAARGAHFAWWLGPLGDNPILGPSATPTRLDVTARGYAEYVRDFRSLEWFRVPTRTAAAHVTGPYVDHLCTCEYILTFTCPVPASDGDTAAVVGADIAVRRWERELLPTFLRADRPVALLNADGRVILSTSADAAPGTLAGVHGAAAACRTAPFTVVAL